MVSQKKREDAQRALEEKKQQAAIALAEKQGIDPNALAVAQAAQRGEINRDAVEGAAANKLKEMNPDVADAVLGEDGKFDKDKAMESGKAAAVDKFREEHGELADAILSEDGNFDEDKAKAAARAAAAEKLKEKYGEGVAGEAMSLIGDDGLPDKEKLKAKAQGYFTQFTSLVTGKGSKYEALTGQLLDDTNLEGLEAGTSEFVNASEVTDPWLVDDDDDEVGNIDLNLHKRNISKAEQELSDVQFKHTMYDLSYQYYQQKNQEIFVTPSILITSLSSFLSFAASALPEHAQRMTLIVGFMGTVATILTALRSQYAWDTRAEAFRNAASEYHLICLKLKSKLRKEAVSIEAWEKTWKEIDLRKEELQRKIQVFPPTALVTKWLNQGKFAQHDSKRGALLPPWTMPYVAQLRKDGITTAEDFEFIDPETFDLWDAENTYPKVIIAKVMDTKQQMVEERTNPTKTSGGIHLAEVQFKASTQEAFRRRGVTETNKLRFVNDSLLDLVVEELIRKETPPLPESWSAIEEAVILYHKYGYTFYTLGRSLHKSGLIPVQLTPAAHKRIEKIEEAEELLAKTAPKERITPKKNRAASFTKLIKSGTSAGTESLTNLGKSTVRASQELNLGEAGKGPRSRLGKVKVPGRKSKKTEKDEA